MNIIFKQITLHNFMSIGDTTLVFDDSWLTVISGVNNCTTDGAISNGSGKSSIWEGLIWCLTGDTMRGTRDVVNHNGVDGTYVEVEFLVDDTKFKVIRYKNYKKSGTDLKVYLNGEDKSGKGVKDSELVLSKYLPDLTGTLLGSVVVLGQGLPSRFTNNTPAGRKEVLEYLSKSDYMIEDVKVRVADRKQALIDEDAELKTKLAELTASIKIYEDRLASIEASITNMGQRDSLDTKKAEITAALLENECSISTLYAEVQSAQNTLNEYTSKFEKNRDAKSTKLQEFDSIYHEKLDSLNDSRNKLDSERRIVKKYIDDANSIHEICPTCGQRITGAHRPDTSKWESQLIDLKQQISDINNEITEYVNKSSNERADLTKTYDIESDNIKKLGTAARADLNEKTSQHLKALDSRSNILSSLTAIEESIKNYDTLQRQYLDEQKSIQKQLNEWNSEILYINKSREDVQSRLEVNSKLNTIVTRDFRGYLLSNVISFIDSKAKEYCKDIFGTESIEFRLDGNNVYIGYDGKAYESLSGGERQKVDLIIQFSLRDMLSTFLDFKSNILVLDEIFDNLDSKGCEQIMNVISTKFLDISNLYIITHHADELNIPHESELVMVKDENGFSGLRVA